jgi:tetratricopeptide (TPR) repeat protein
MASLPLILSLCVVEGGCSQRPEGTLAEIRQLHEEGRFEDSVAPLQALLEEDRERPELHYLLGWALFQIGQSSSAIWPLRRAAEHPTYAVQAGLVLTRALLLGRNADDAVAAADRVLEVEPENLVARELRLEALSAGARHEGALQEIDRVLELDPENLTVLAPRLSALIALERIDEAESALEAARRQLDVTERDTPEALRARLCITSGLFFFEKGEPERAEARYAQCLEEFPTQPLAVHEGALFYDRIGHSERATQIIRSAYAAFPDDFRWMLAQRMLALGNTDEVERLLVEATQEDPSPGTWSSLADHYVDAEDYPAALRAFERALEIALDPDPMLLFAYADTLIQAAEYTRALQVADDLDSAMLRDLITGRALLARGDAQGALTALESGLRLWPDNATARLLAGQAAEQLGHFERAVVHYRGALRAGRGSTEAGALLAELYAAQGNRRLALELARRHVTSRPQDPQAYLLATRVARRTGRYDVCRKVLAELAELPGQAPVALAEEIALEAALHGAEAALAVLEIATPDLTDPANASVLRASLEQLALLGAHERAREQVAAALHAHPEAAIFHELRARALQAEGAPAEAQRAAFERALDLDPRHAPALAGLAQLAAQANDVERALALYDRAARTQPADPSAAHAASRLLIAQERIDEAQTRLDALLQRHPRHAEAATELARLLLHAGRGLERARVLAQRAALFGPGPDPYEVLGRVQLELGEREAAVESFVRGLEFAPEHAALHYGLGLALQAVGDAQGAREAFRAALASEHPLPETQRAALQKALAAIESGRVPHSEP